MKVRELNRYFFKAVLFDFDGVLIDSLMSMQLSWRSVKNKFGIKNSFDEYSKYIGLPFNEILKRLNIDKEIHNIVKEYYFKESSRHFNQITLNPNVNELISWLHKEKILTGIVTSKDYERTTKLIEHFQINVNIFVTPELTSLGKPNPEPILFATKKLKVETSKTLFIGDMLSDMTCAENASCEYLHYCPGYQTKGNFDYGGLIYDLLDIKEFIQNY